MSGTTSSHGLRSAFSFGLRVVRNLLVATVAIGAAVGWLGLWATVTRIHYLAGDWGAVVLAVLLGVGPPLLLGTWALSLSGLPVDPWRLPGLGGGSSSTSEATP